MEQGQLFCHIDHENMTERGANASESLDKGFTTRNPGLGQIYTTHVDLPHTSKTSPCRNLSQSLMYFKRSRRLLQFPCIGVAQVAYTKPISTNSDHDVETSNKPCSHMAGDLQNLGERRKVHSQPPDRDYISCFLLSFANISHLTFVMLNVRHLLKFSVQSC